MAKAPGLGTEEEKKPTTETTTAGAQGNTQTGTNIFGGVVPNGVRPSTQTPTTETPAGGANPSASATETKNLASAGFYSALGNSNNNAETKTETAEQRAQTSLAQLKNDYSQALRNQYNYSADKLKAERDAALRENWILQQQAEAALPEQMAASGINGGANATSLAALKAMYQGNRNDIQSGYMDSLGDLQQQQSAEQAEVQKDYNERWLEYLLSLAKKDAI